jgi:hypothetical protein
LRLKRLERVRFVGVVGVAVAGGGEALADQASAAVRPVRRRLPPAGLVVQLDAGRCGPFEPQVGVGVGQVGDGGVTACHHQGGRFAVRRADQPELGGGVLDHRRHQAFLDDRGRHRPRLVDDGHAGRQAVDGLFRFDQPTRPVGQQLDRFLPVGVAHLVDVGEPVAACPTPRRALYLHAHRQVLAGVHDELRFVPTGALVDAPQARLAHQIGLADLAGDGRVDGVPDEQAVVVVLQGAGGDQLLPPAQRAAGALQGVGGQLGAVAADGARVRRCHQPRPRRILRHGAQAGEPRHVPYRVVGRPAVRLGGGRGRRGDWADDGRPRRRPTSGQYCTLAAGAQRTRRHQLTAVRPVQVGV